MDCFCCFCCQNSTCCLDDPCGIIEFIDNYRDQSEQNKLVIKIKTLLILLLGLSIPSMFTTYLGIFFTSLSVVAILIGHYGMIHLQKSATVVYCSISELCFFLGSYNLFQFLENSNIWISFPSWGRIVVIITFVLWSLGTMLCIKYSLDVYKQPEKDHLMIDIEISNQPHGYNTFDFFNENNSNKSSPTPPPLSLYPTPSSPPPTEDTISSSSRYQ